MVPAGDHMEIRESSRVRTPFTGYFMHDRIGTPINWCCPPSVGRTSLTVRKMSAKKILALMRRSDKAENRLARDTRRIERVLADTRAKGYGTRDPSFGGGAYGRQAPDGLAGIAVPLLTVAGSMA